MLPPCVEHRTFLITEKCRELVEDELRPYVEL